MQPGIITENRLFWFWPHLNHFFSWFRISTDKNFVHLSTPSIGLDGQAMGVTRRLFEFTLLPAITLFLVDHTRNKKTMENLVLKFIKNTPSEKLRASCCTDYGKLSVWVSEKYTVVHETWIWIARCKILPIHVQVKFLLSPWKVKILLEGYWVKFHLEVAKVKIHGHPN